jgi:hypothetical protein
VINKIIKYTKGGVVVVVVVVEVLVVLVETVDVDTVVEVDVPTSDFDPSVVLLFVLLLDFEVLVKASPDSKVVCRVDAVALNPNTCGVIEEAPSLAEWTK